MPRPKKFRKVCCLPESNMFGPVPARSAKGEIIALTIDEYETIRLIDYEGMSQEQCAEGMNVARTTVQRMYVEARKKISDCIINGRLMKIEGGDYMLCDETEGECRYNKCFKSTKLKNKKEKEQE